MFILDTDRVPSASNELAVAIGQSLRKWILLPANSSPVHIAGNLPNLTELKVDVTGGRIASTDSLPFEKTTGDLEPGPTAAKFTIIGHPISIADIPLQLDLTADNASFSYARSPEQKLIANLQDASHGQLSIQLRQTDLDAAAIMIARKFAGDKISIQSITVALNSISPTEVNLLLTITAKKFVTAVIRVTGKVTISNQMTAAATNLKATSEGMVGNIAVGLLQPQLQKLEGQPLPLLAFSLGNVKLRVVEIHTTNGLQISAAFGSGTSMMGSAIF